MIAFQPQLCQTRRPSPNNSSVNPPRPTKSQTRLHQPIHLQTQYLTLHINPHPPSAPSTQSSSHFPIVFHKLSAPPQHISILQLPKHALNHLQRPSIQFNRLTVRGIKPNAHVSLTAGIKSSKKAVYFRGRSGIGAFALCNFRGE